MQLLESVTNTSVPARPLPFPQSNCTMTTKAQIQKPAPQFEVEAVVNGDFKTVKLRDYVGKYVVLLFYPLDFTFVCPTELIAFSDRAKEFDEIDCAILGFSVDSVYTHLAWSNTPRNHGGIGNLAFPHCSDLTKKVSRDYGILIEDGSDAGVALRGLFIIDGKGILRQVTVNDLPIGRSVDETLRLVKALQFTDKYGEVCPANWKPGSDTIKADPKESQTYFSKISAT
jgi:alkyl hydroperoxide reductase subunit AhpC